MIGYLEGTLLKKGEDRILLLANQVGYEILLPAIVMETLRLKKDGEDLSLYIYYHQTERQPKPVLIGFNVEDEKEFFQNFITVEAIGPMKAVQAMNIPIQDMANAIENKDVAKLSQLKGIGKRTAQKIIATLEGKVGKFILALKDAQTPEAPLEDFAESVMDVLISQLGHKPADARQMIAQAMKRNSSISTPEDLFEEVYRGEKSYDR